LILRIIIKIDATRCQILRLKCTKIVFGWGSSPDPAGGAYSAPQTRSWIKGGLLLREGEGIWEGRGRGRQGREGEREGGEGRGREGTPQYFIAPQFQFSRNMPATGQWMRQLCVLMCAKRLSS